MTRKEEYNAYLKSNEWQWLKNEVMYRAKGICELCGKTCATEVHHVKYPKMFSEDHPDNLLALCQPCHDKQHGIRVDKMSNELISNSQKISFVFCGKSGKEYNFEFLMLNGKPWVPLSEVERKLYLEDEIIEDSSKYSRPENNKKFTRTGRLLPSLAGTQLSPDYRMLSDGETWVRASGAFQLLAKSESPAGQDFREQLGDWLESQVMHGQDKLRYQATSEALFDAGQARGGSLIALQGLLNAMIKHEESLAMVSQECKRIDQKTDQISDIANDAKAIAEANQRLVQDVLEVGWMITNEYIKCHAPNLATQENSKNFGGFIVQELKKKGGYKTNDGWFYQNQQVSKLIPWPGMPSQKINKWHEKIILDKLWPVFYESINTGKAKIYWNEFIRQSNLSGVAFELAKSCKLESFDSGIVKLALESSAARLRVASAEIKLREALCNYLGESVRLEISVPVSESMPYQRSAW